MCGVRPASSKADPPFHLALGDLPVQGPVCPATQEGCQTRRRGRERDRGYVRRSGSGGAEDCTGDALRKCLTLLSPEHREIVDLVYYHEKSVEEVAEIVGIPENTVKTRLFYARKKLAELLKAAGVERGWP